MALGGSEMGMALSEHKAINNTPEGMEVKEFKTLQARIVEYGGGSELAQETANLFVDLATGGKNMGKLLADDKLIEAIIHGTNTGLNINDIFENYTNEDTESQSSDGKNETNKEER